MRTPLLLLTLAALASGCGGASHQPAAKADAASPIDVRVSTVESRRLVETFEAGGVVQALSSATLSSRIMATVRDVRVSPGDRVRQGQVVVVLDDRDLSAMARQASSARQAADDGIAAAQAELAGAQAGLTLAKASYERISTLKAKNSATPNEYDQATAGLRGAESRLAAAEARVRQATAAQASASAASDVAGVSASFAQVAAPFDGVITEKLVDPGNMVSPGAPLLRMEDPRGFRLDVRVDEARAAFVKVDDQAPVFVDAPSGATQVTGTVKEIARSIDADARSFLVKIALPDAPVRSGAFGRARLAAGTRTGLTVPAAAVVRHGQVTSVFVIDGDHARLRLVHLGPTVDDRVEVLAGLAAGDRVIDAPASDLTDGRLVKVAGVSTPAGGAR